jgi:tetratricopeptide (TPR) repeat protein
VAAADAFRHAEAVFREVTEVAPSDPESYAGTCRVWRDVMQSSRFGGTSEMRRTLDRAVAACDRALAVDSMRLAEINVKAECYLTLGARHLAVGEDPGEALAAARASAERVLQIEPENPNGLRALGNAHALAVEWWTDARREDAVPPETVREWSDRAVDNLAKASSLKPEDASGLLDLGRALVVQARFLSSQGDDSRHVFSRAQEVLDRAAGLSPGAPEIHLASARAWLMTALQEEVLAGDPITGYDQAIAAAQRTIAIRPDHLEANYSLGISHLRRAEYLMERSHASAADLASAVEAFQRCLAIDADFTRADAPLARSASLLAEQQLTAGADPTETLIPGRAAAERAVRQSPDDVRIRRSLAMLLLISAEASPHQNQRLWWAERAVDLLSRLPEGARGGEWSDYLVRARQVVREVTG